MTMDITTAGPSPVLARVSAEHRAADVSLSGIPAGPLDLDLTESPKVRTKLRLYAILSALYVSSLLSLTQCDMQHIRKRLTVPL